MSHSMSSIQRKIAGAKDLQSVVRTMKAIAASQVGQFEKSVLALADYKRTVEQGLGVCFREQATELLAPQGNPRPTATVINAVIFGSDQGLVGRFNEVIADFALDSINKASGDLRIWAVGDRVRARLVELHADVSGTLIVPNSVKAIAPLIAEILLAVEGYNSADSVSELHLFHNRPTKELVYEPVGQRLLPLDASWQREMVELSWPTMNPPQVIGRIDRSVRALTIEYLFVTLFRACAESLASENASRLAAMRRADKNIDELLTNLHTSFHRLRQGTIDEELFDLVAGYEALQE